MNAGDVSRVSFSSQETWLSTRLSDPNAGLWASITPPANPTLKQIVRRRATAFSLDLLAQRLHLRFPETFSSRTTARFGILGAALAFGIGVGVLGYFTQPRAGDADSMAGRAQASVVESAPTQAATSVERSASSSATGVRLGETSVDGAARPAAPMLAATARPATEQVTASLTPRTLSAAPSADVTAEPRAAAKAKRGASARKAKASARRATKLRRARIASR